MSPRGATIALNPLQWYVTDDGWLDWAIGPSLPDLLQIVKEIGFDAVPALVPADSSAREYGRLVADAGLTLVPGTRPFTLAEDGVSTDGMLESYRRSADQYAELGLGYMFVQNAVLPDAARIRQPGVGAFFSQDRLDRVVELLAEVGRVTTAAGVLPILHPHVGTWVETADEIRYVLDNVPAESLGLGVDTGHVQWGARMDPAELTAEYSERTFGVHVKDCKLAVIDAATEAGLTYQETVLAGVWAEPGRGDLDFERLWAALPADYAGSLVVEVDRGSLESPLESARACARWARAQTADA